MQVLPLNYIRFQYKQYKDCKVNMTIINLCVFEMKSLRLRNHEFGSLRDLEASPPPSRSVCALEATPPQVMFYLMYYTLVFNYLGDREYIDTLA